MSRNIVVEFVSSISDDDLKFLTSRLTERLQGDIAEAVEFMSHYKQLDAVLATAKSADDIFEFCDQVTDVLQKECKRRGVQLSDRPQK